MTPTLPSSTAAPGTAAGAGPDPTGTDSPLVVLDGLDWRTFAAHHWDRRPVLFKGVGTAPFATDEVFEAAVAAAHGADERMPDGVEFGTEAASALEPHGRLPRPEDGSLAGYAARMRRVLDGERYQLTVHGFHAHHASLWFRERAFLAGLWEHTGQPATGVITTLFHGNYRYTAVGAHKDSFATFMFALHGRKRMRFWPTRPWNHPVSTVLDYQPYLDTSFTADAEPGDLLYWPADYYHVGESDLSDQPATSVNIGVARRGFGARAAADLLGAAPEEAPDGADRTADDLPAELVDALAELRGSVAEPGRRAAALGLAYATSGGLHPAPPPADSPPVGAATRLHAVAPVRWSVHEGTVLCAANGHTTSTTLAPETVVALLRLLPSDGPARTVGDLVEALPGAATPPAVCALLTTLVRFRALRTVPVPVGRPTGAASPNGGEGS